MLLKVGELAQRTGLTVRTLHHYDEIGLLKPSGRSDAGYRLYSDADVQRLHGIQALRHMGLALAHIHELLQDPALNPQRVLAQQMHALDVQIAQATQLRDRLALMHDGMVAGAKPDMGNWLETLALMSTYGKYFSAAELQRIFERWQLVRHEWGPLIAQAEAAMASGLPPDAVPVQRLANQWMAVMLCWMGGDMDLLDRWGHMYRQEPTAQGVNQAPTGPVMAYMEAAIALRVAILHRYFTRDELSRLGFVAPAQWQALEDEVLPLLAQQTPPSSPEARAALQHWQRLMGQLSNHDAALQSKLQACYAAEPLLRAGTTLPPQVREFLGAAAAAWAAKTA